jgi:hypothetical protein
MACVALLLSGLSFAQRGLNDGIVWRAYRQGTQSRITQAQNLVIQNQGAFDTYWQQSTGESRAPRDVDFNKELLITVHLGNRTSGGYRVIIQSVQRVRPGEIKVSYVENMPAPGGFTASVMTSPFEIVRVERSNAVGSFVFEGRKRVDGATEAPAGNEFGWRTYIHETMGGGPRELTRAIVSAQELEAYWSQIGFGGRVPSDIDWNTEMLIVLHLGTRGTTGYDVLVDRLEAVPGGVTVHYLEKAPAQGQRTRATATSPYVIIRLARFQGGLQYRKRIWRSDG